MTKQYIFISTQAVFVCPRILLRCVCDEWKIAHVDNMEKYLSQY